jgi:hypothetical protein
MRKTKYIVKIQSVKTYYYNLYTIIYNDCLHNLYDIYDVHYYYYYYYYYYFIFEKLLLHYTTYHNYYYYFLYITYIFTIVLFYIQLKITI